MNRIKLNKYFDTESPVFDKVPIAEVWGYWDGPLFGICEIFNKKLFYCDIIESVWRTYEYGKQDRLWRIYAVYDIKPKEVKSLINGEDRSSWQDKIEEYSECVGIFWNYDRKDK